MLRGVNKQIIELNDIENEYFEKAILYVKPKHTDVSEDALKAKAGQYVCTLFAEKDCDYVFLKGKNMSRKISRRWLAIIGVLIMSAVVVGTTLLKIL